MTCVLVHHVCTDRAETWTNVSGRASCCPSIFILFYYYMPFDNVQGVIPSTAFFIIWCFAEKCCVRREKLVKVRKFNKHTYIHVTYSKHLQYLIPVPGSSRYLLLFFRFYYPLLMIYSYSKAILIFHSRIIGARVLRPQTDRCIVTVR